MGRKNGSSKAVRKDRRPQARKRDPLALPTKPRRSDLPPPVPVSQMVVPVGRCGRKAKFATEDDAKGALKQAQQTRARRGQGYVETRYYQHATCGGWHLTSLEYAKNGDTQ